MKIQTLITDINQEDLVNLFSTATYGSEYLDCAFRKSDYYGTDLEDENDCREDKWAKLLLAGKSIFVYDYYSEEESYGNLPQKWIPEKEAMRYELTLEDIKKAVQSAVNNSEYTCTYAMDWINDSCNFDLIEAESLLQHIVFGEVIYG